MELLLKLMHMHGPSGNEGSVRELLRKEMRAYVDEVFVDKFGNLVCHKKGNKPTVMLVAHMDEVGIMVKRVDENGFISCDTVGYIEPLTLLGERVEIEAKEKLVPGVISMREIMNDEEIPKESIRLDALIVDTGLNKEQLHNLGVRTGSYIYLRATNSLFGDGAYVCGKALDDRVGCYILVELAKQLKNAAHDMYYVFTVQEEIGLYGAKTSVYNIDPSWAIIVDVSNSDDFREHPTKFLGRGPCLIVKDAEMITNRCLNQWLLDLARKMKITLQPEVGDVGMTDALSISVSKGGVPCTVIGPSVRNIHTTQGVASVKDIKDTIALLSAFIKKAPKSCLP